MKLVELTGQERDIIKKNLELADCGDLPIMDFLDKQEALINQFMGLGHTRAEFFEAACQIKSAEARQQ